MSLVCFFRFLQKFEVFSVLVNLYSPMKRNGTDTMNDFDQVLQSRHSFDMQTHFQLSCSSFNLFYYHINSHNINHFSHHWLCNLPQFSTYLLFHLLPSPLIIQFRKSSSVKLIESFCYCTARYAHFVSASHFCGSEWIDFFRQITWMIYSTRNIAHFKHSLQRQINY